LMTSRKAGSCKVFSFSTICSSNWLSISYSTPYGIKVLSTI
jgi:hypothetical protein